LWDQLHLAIVLWLQISYFSGAHHIFNIAIRLGRAWRKRHREMLRRRRRASSVAGAKEKFEEVMRAIPILSNWTNKALRSSTMVDNDEHTDDGARDSGIDHRESEDGISPPKDDHPEPTVKTEIEEDHDMGIERVSASDRESTVHVENEENSSDDYVAVEHQGE